MSKPKIIVCATAYHPFVGGAEIAIQEVARRLSGQFDFLVLTARMSRALPRRETHPEGTIIRLGIGARFDKWFLPFLIPWYLCSHFQSKFQVPSSKFLLWGMDIGQGALGAAMAKFFYPRIPFILTVQYGETLRYLHRGRAGLILYGFRIMLARADVVTAISSYLMGIARAQGFCGPAEVIPNGVDITRFQNTNSKLQTKHKTQNTRKEKTIITVSRLVAKNGIDVLIDAVAEVKRMIPDIRCVIIGDGPERKNYESRIKNHGLEYTIQMMGQISHTDIAEYLHTADVFVRPSRSEGMGSAFVEAMAAGLPVIGSAVGGIPDVIEHEKSGLLTRPEDTSGLAEAIIRLLRNPSFAQNIARAGQEKARERFDWDGIAQAYRRVFLREMDMKKRIVIATGLFPPEIGGPATYSKLLVEGLPQRGIGFRVAPFRAVRRFPKIFRHLVYCWEIVFVGRGSDIIFAQDPVSTGLPALLAARLMRKKFLLKIVGDYAWEQHQFQVPSSKFQVQNEDASLEEFQKGTYDFITETRRAVQKFVARRAARVIVPSEYLKGIVMQWGVPKEKIAVIYNAFEPPRALPSREEARGALGIPPGTFLVVSAGRLVPWKGFGELIGAVAAVQREIPKTRLIIVGSGPDENALRKKIEEARAGEVVSLAGSVSHEEILRHFRAADLFVLNSSYEGFSHTLLEAMVMEAPVMASDVGGNKEIITDGVNGRLYQYRDASSVAYEAVRLYKDRELTGHFTTEGKRAMGRFSTDAMIASTAELISSL